MEIRSLLIEMTTVLTTYYKCWRSNEEERCLSRQRQGQDEGREDKESDDEIEYGEPSVFGGRSPQNLARDERPSHAWNRIEE